MEKLVMVVGGSRRRTRHICRDRTPKPLNLTAVAIIIIITTTTTSILQQPARWRNTSLSPVAMLLASWWLESDLVF